jgi:hypothetical protein
MSSATNVRQLSHPRDLHLLVLVVSWAWVGIPLLWGVWQTLRTSLALFR